MSEVKKSVVIIGGGFTGSHCAKKLEKYFDVTLIDTKDYFEFTPGILRTIVEPEHAGKIQVLHTSYLRTTKIIHGRVVDVKDFHVVLSNKKKIKYDYLVIASGSTYNKPIKDHNIVLATRANDLRDHYDELCRAKKVLIIGGGYVGSELAAEIAERYDDKEITIVQAADHLLVRNPPKVVEYATKYFLQKRVHLLLGERVKGKKGKYYLTQKRKKLKTDMAFMCVGIIPNSSFMKKSHKKVLAERGHIKVNDYLQVEGHSNVFAGGDVTSIREEKTAQNAQKQAEVIVDNIYALENKNPLKSYKSKPRVMVISLGKWTGILTYKNFVLTGLIPGIFKNVIEWLEMRKYK